MPRRKLVIICLAVLGIVGSIVLSTLPSAPPLKVKVLKRESAQILDDGGADMVLLTLGLNRPDHESWVYVGSGAKIEARIAGHWKTLENTLSPGSLGGGETREEVILVPCKADRCRINLRYAGPSIRWRFAGWLSRRGVWLSPKYWAEAGWPRPEGQNPRWRTSSVEIRLEQDPSADRTRKGA